MQKYKKSRGTETKRDYRIAYEKCGGIWYRIRQRKNEVGDTQKQILVPKSLRANVTEVVHDSLFGGDLGVKKTEDRIQTNFFWSRLHDVVTSFYRLCDVCQKMVPKGSVPRAPLKDMLLIDQPFKRVAIYLVEPIAPTGDKGQFVERPV